MIQYLLKTFTSLKEYIRKVRYFFLALLAITVIESCFIQISYISSTSMSPTIKKNSFVLVNKLPTKCVGNFPIKRGQIVALHWPISRSIILIKRVVGVPGDKINLSQKNQFRSKKGTYTTSSSSIYKEKRTTRRLQFGKNNLTGENYLNDFCNLQVPSNMYFVVGDNKENSDDSRSWGFISEEQITGIVHIL